MSSPFEQVGFNTTPSFQQVGPQAQPQAQPLAPATTPVTTPQTAVDTTPSKDSFQPSSATNVDVEALKQEIKEELKQEMSLSTDNKPVEKEKKKGPIKKLKNFIGSIKKFNAQAGEYIKGFFKGIGSGALVGGAGFGAFKLVEGIKLKQAGKIVEEAAKEAATKSAGKFGKIGIAAAVVGVVGALTVNLWKASLNASEKKALIDHRWDDTPINTNKK